MVAKLDIGKLRTPSRANFLFVRDSGVVVRSSAGGNIWLRGNPVLLDVELVPIEIGIEWIPRSRMLSRRPTIRSRWSERIRLPKARSPSSRGGGVASCRCSRRRRPRRVGAFSTVRPMVAGVAVQAWASAGFTRRFPAGKIASAASWRTVMDTRKRAQGRGEGRLLAQSPDDRRFPAGRAVCEGRGRRRGVAGSLPRP